MDFSKTNLFQRIHLNNNNNNSNKIIIIIIIVQIVVNKQLKIKNLNHRIVIHNRHQHLINRKLTELLFFSLKNFIKKKK